jgi:hypothetical protein
MKITALYERLSSGDDGRDGDSNSIKNQKLQLESYAKAQGFGNAAITARHTRRLSDITTFNAPRAAE